MGVALQAGDHLPVAPPAVWRLGAPWLLAAFAAGAAAATRPRRGGGARAGERTARGGLLVRHGAGGGSPTTRGALAGAILLAAAVAGYYALLAGAQGPRALPYALAMTVAWGVAAAGLGALAGAAGAAWAAGPDGIAVVAGAAPAAMLMGEALLLRADWGGWGAEVLAAELLAGALAVPLLVRRAGALLPAAATAALLAVAFAAGEEGVRAAMRLAGWGGA
jgi:hypothetical protein